MPDRLSNRDYFNRLEEEATPEELRDIALNAISLLVLLTTLLFLIALPFFS